MESLFQKCLKICSSFTSFGNRLPKEIRYKINMLKFKSFYCDPLLDDSWLFLKTIGIITKSLEESNYERIRLGGISFNMKEMEDHIFYKLAREEQHGYSYEYEYDGYSYYQDSEILYLFEIYFYKYVSYSQEYKIDIYPYVKINRYKLIDALILNRVKSYSNFRKKAVDKILNKYGL